MTAATFSGLPLTAGGALAGSLVRGGVWTASRLIDLGFWGVAQFMRAPFAISAVAAIAGFSILAGSNALYFQTSRHPAPLFFAQPPHHAAPAPFVKPVIPAPRPHFQPAAIDTETTGSLGVQPVLDTIDTDDVLQLQKKLVALKLLDGTADGMFGRRTATAIKAFETKTGLPARGKLSKPVMAAIMAAPVPNAQPLPERVVTTASLAPTTTADLQPAAAKPLALAAQPQPTPLAVPQAAAAAPAPVVDTFTANSDLPPAPAQQAPIAVAAAPAAEQTLAPDQPVAPEPVASAMPATDASTPGATAVAMTSPPSDDTFGVAPATDAPLTPGQRLAAQMGTLPPEATVASAIAPATLSDGGELTGSTDPALISKIQRALASLGFLGAKIDGVPGEGTAKAIRNFEVFYDYRVTGLATPQLLNLLLQRGAVI